MSLSAQILRHIRTLGDAIAQSSKQPIRNAPTHDIVWGVVDSIQMSPHLSLTVFVSGSPTSQAGIRCLASYAPTVGDTVMMINYDHDYVVIGGIRGVVPGFGNTYHVEYVFNNFSSSTFANLETVVVSGSLKYLVIVTGYFTFEHTTTNTTGSSARMEFEISYDGTTTPISSVPVVYAYADAAEQPAAAFAVSTVYNAGDVASHVVDLLGKLDSINGDTEVFVEFDISIIGV